MNFINQLIDSSFISALGWTIIHSIWQGAAVAILLITALMILSHKSARLRYLLAIGAMLILTSFSVKTFIYYHTEYSSDASYEFSFTTLSFENDTDAEVQLIGSETSDMSALSKFLSEFKLYFDENLHLVVSLYLIGLLFLLLKLMGGLILTLRLRHSGKSIPAQHFQKSVTSIAERLGIKRNIELLESRLVNIPVTIGHFKPMILIPIGTLTGIPSAQLEAILAHEIAHIRRADYLINIFQSVIEVLFFFNPSVWWISGIIRDERENICDDLAIEVCGESLTLVKALVSVSELNYSNKNLAMAVLGNKNKLFRRINRMTGGNKIKSSANKLFAVSFVLIAMISLGFFSCGTTNGYEKNSNGNYQYEQNFDVDETKSTNVEIEIESENSNDYVKEMTFEFNENWNGEDVRWKVNMLNDEIVELYKDGKLVPKDEYHVYEDLVLNSVAEFENEIDELDEDKVFVDKELSIERNQLREFDYEIIAETGDTLKKSIRKMKTYFDSKEFKEEMNKLKDELRELKEHPPKIKWDKEKFEKEMEAHREAMRKMKFEVQIDSEEFQKGMEQLSKSLENLEIEIPHIDIPDIEIPEIEIDLSELEESMKQLKVEMSKLDIDMTELKEEMRKMDKFLKELKSELVNDGLVDKYEKIDHLELNEDSMYLNYDKVPDHLFKKYREIYKKHYGKYPDEDQKFSILR